MQRRVVAVVERPTKAHPVPRLIDRILSQQEPKRVWNGASELLERCRPMVGSLKDRERLDLVLDERRNLHTTGAVTNNGHSFAFEAHVVSPLSRVERRASEGLDAVDLWGNRRIEDASTADDHVGGANLDRSVG